MSLIDAIYAFVSTDPSYTYSFFSFATSKSAYIGIKLAMTAFFAFSYWTVVKKQIK